MKHLFTFSFMLLCVAASFAQYSTKGFSFQGYASDPEGKALGSVGITVKFTLTSGSVTTRTYAEEQNLTTDAYGVFSATIGNGSVVSSGTPFAALNMHLYLYKLKVEVKKTVGGSYTTISEEDLNAVPYARAAENGVPVGTIVAFGGDINLIPVGWALCDGSLKERTDPEWQALYSVIFGIWGYTGTQFRVPDLRGEFLRGVDGGSNRDEDRDSRSAAYTGGRAGDAVGSYQADQYRSHNHSASTSTAGNHNHSYHDVNNGGNTVDYRVGSDGFKVSEYYKANGSTGDAGDHSHGVTVNANGGSESRPENAAVYYIIKK